MSSHKTTKPKCSFEQMEANSAGFIWSDLVGYRIKLSIRPSEAKLLEEALLHADAWVVVCGLLRGLNRTEASEYSASDLRRAA